MYIDVLKKYFGYEQFRDAQEDIINDIMSGRDTLGIMPTGAGKSICFQIPAIVKDGITIVISPLISLMQDQVKTLINLGISAAYINSSLSPRQVENALYNASNNKYKIIYVAPERLLTDSFLSFAQNSNIAMLTVDEAHCISQWGQDFRPSYAQIPDFIDKLDYRPVISAFTATATQRVKEDIVKILQLKNPLVVVSGFDRENLYFEVKQSSDKFYDLMDFLSERKDKSGIIYCSTRKTVEQVYEKLISRGILVGKYHAGLTQNDRIKFQNEFLYDRIDIMVATNAFGMGIDKSNVNYVVHYNMPKDMESYYQEAGRAGRDGSFAYCTMLYNGQDVVINKFLIDQNNYEDIDEETAIILKEQEYRRLRDITYYSTTTECLRAKILRYFGEQPKAYCGNCSNCNTSFEVIDVTLEAKKIISCIKRMGERFGKVMVIDVLKGSKNKKVLDLGFDKLSTYGISELSGQRLRTVIDSLVSEGYLEETTGQYPTIITTAKSLNILRDIDRIEIKLLQEKIKQAPTPKALPEDKSELFELLRALRSDVAKRQGVPSFVVFSDSSLIDMCKKMPTDKKQFRLVSGVGEQKCEKYAEEFTTKILDYCVEHGIEINKKEAKKKRLESLVLPSEDIIAEIEIEDKPLQVSLIARNINEVLESYECTKISAYKIANWLLNLGYLELSETGKNKVPSEKGTSEGITQEERERDGNFYKVNLFPTHLQEMIIDNVCEILDS